MSVQRKGDRGRPWARLALAASCFLVACASSSSGSGSNTNWVVCRLDRDCQGNERCVSDRCTALDGGDTAWDDGAAASLHLLGRDGGPGVCTGEAYRAELAPAEASALDVYMMVDQSSSMGDPIPGGNTTWWSSLQSGVSNFANAPGAAGMGVGLQYFPLGGTAPASCTADYATPDVDVGALPANASALVASIQSHAPNGFTPTGPALSGAIVHMKAWASGHPGRVPVVVLLTDGFPTECAPQQIVDIATIAQDGLAAEPRVRTFVVGVNLGANGANLDTVARAGGTHSAFLIASGDLSAELTRAMHSIAVAPLKCAFTLPPREDGGTLDPSLVALRSTPASGGAPEDVPLVASADDCVQKGGRGFYFDPPENPTQAIACSGTCASSDGGTLELVVHCAPTSPPSNR